MSNQRYVDIAKTQDGTELRGQCLESALPAWEAAGWTAVDNGSSEESKTQTPPAEVTNTEE